MKLTDKLEKIYVPSIKALPTGEATALNQFWAQLVKDYLPAPEVVLKWHDVLMKYIKADHPVFAIRGYNTFPKERYGDLRRGFLTETTEYNFFHTDNFFAAYFQKMAIDGFIPTVEELEQVFTERKFPSRFGINTSEERALLAIKQGKDPRINSNGFKLAHIIPVGMNYKYKNTVLGMQEILYTYFPKGERSDYVLKTDKYGSYRARTLVPQKEAKDFAIAHFLRFVHPFNYFLCPKKNCEENNRCKELAEYSPLLSYAHDYNLALYGDKYKEFLALIMPLDDYYSKTFNSTYNGIIIKYGLNIQPGGDRGSPAPIKAVKQDRESSTKYERNITLNVISNVNVTMAFEYLSNPHTSFRKLEVQYLGLESPARGGGFISKGIINSLGITAEMKGVLQFKSLDTMIASSKGILLDTLIKIKAELV